MSNRVIVKFGFIAAVFFFASCHSDVPSLPSPDEVNGYKWCRYYNNEGERICKSAYEISESDCTAIDGQPFSTEQDCKE